MMSSLSSRLTIIIRAITKMIIDTQQHAPACLLTTLVCDLPLTCQCSKLFLSSIGPQNACQVVVIIRSSHMAFSRGVTGTDPIISARTRAVALATRDASLRCCSSLLGVVAM